jgi:hypothetical protein
VPVVAGKREEDLEHDRAERKKGVGFETVHVCFETIRFWHI